MEWSERARRRVRTVLATSESAVVVRLKLLLLLPKILLDSECRLVKNFLKEKTNNYYSGSALFKC